MALPFRRRLFLGLVAIGTLPLAAVLVVLAAQLRTSGSPVGPRAALEEITESGRQLIATLDTTALSPEARSQLDAHVRTINQRTTLARRAETITGTAAGILAVVVVVGTIVIVGISIWLARRWASTVSAPVDELTEWVRRIQHGHPVPAAATRDDTPEFNTLRLALREMADHLTRARRESIERERLLAFRETARRVAHEIRGPLTAMRLATGQVVQHAPTDVVEVLEEETKRLDQLAREFAEFGRLPEGPTSRIDVGQLLRGVVDATLPSAHPVVWSLAPGLFVNARYEPLRRSIQNILANACEASGDGEIAIDSTREDDRAIITISDSGPGISPDDHERIFAPYHTTKPAGTGLGLAIARQAIESHGGTIRATNAPDGGARLIISLPAEGP